MSLPEASRRCAPTRSISWFRFEWLVTRSFSVVEALLDLERHRALDVGLRDLLRLDQDRRGRLVARAGAPGRGRSRRASPDERPEHEPPAPALDDLDRRPRSRIRPLAARVPTCVLTDRLAPPGGRRSGRVGPEPEALPPRLMDSIPEAAKGDEQVRTRPQRSQSEISTPGSRPCRSSGPGPRPWARSGSARGAGAGAPRCDAGCDSGSRAPASGRPGAAAPGSISQGCT